MGFPPAFAGFCGNIVGCIGITIRAIVLCSSTDIVKRHHYVPGH